MYEPGTFWLEAGIEVVELEIPPEAYGIPEPRLWVRAREHGPAGDRHAAGKCLTSASQVGCAWQPGFHVADLDGLVNAMTVFDDGSGEALYVGGEFTAANGVAVNDIARWDGNAWSPLSGPSGSGMGGLYPYVRALTVFDDGSGPALFAGGEFAWAGGVEANYIARWDGTAWSALSGPSDTGMDDYVYALGEFNDGSGATLFAGGSFATAGGLVSNRIAAWRCVLFADGFESGNTSAWSVTVP